MTDQELLSIYMDGALDPAQMDEVEARLAKDESFAALLEKMAEGDEAIHAAFDPVLEMPVPEHLTEAAWSSAVLPKAANDNRNSYWFAGGAIAASLLAGLAFFGGPSEPKPDPLQIALNKTPSGQTVQIDANTRFAAQLSFPAKDGSFCREFMLTGKERSKVGLACGSDGKWRIEALDEAAGDAETGYAAAGADQSRVDTLAEARRAGDPLSPVQEATQIRGKWNVK